MTHQASLGASFQINRAIPEDADALLKLYLAIYGTSYPLAFGTSREVMLKTMASENILWLVAREPVSGAPIGSIVFDVDLIGKIGKVGGLVVDPQYRRHNLGAKLVATGTAQLLAEGGPVNSIYTTARTNSTRPQLICLEDGFIPLGIFPNAHKLKTYETLTLLAKFRPGVLERRAPVEVVPELLGPILGVLEKTAGISTPALLSPARKKSQDEVIPVSESLEFEFVDAPEFVKRKFHKDMSDPYDRFYPFHTPNFLMVSTTGEVEIYAYFSKHDRYCAIVGLNVPVFALAGRLGRLLEQLKELGVSYLELLIGIQYTRSIETALQANFLPSAIYPAMSEDENGKTHDFVVLSRSMEMLDFQGMKIDQRFKPYIDQYVHLWKQMHLDSLEVYYQTPLKS